MQEYSLLLRSLVVLIASSSLPPSLLSFPQKAASEPWGQMYDCLWLPLLLGSAVKITEVTESLTLWDQVRLTLTSLA